jgi:hypothetical protein
MLTLNAAALPARDHPECRRIVKQPNRILARASVVLGQQGQVFWRYKGLGRTPPGHPRLRLARIPRTVWTPVYDGDHTLRDGAWMAEATDAGCDRPDARDADHCP